MDINYEALKKALEEEDAATAAEIIHEVYLKHNGNFMSPILLSDCLPEPLQREFGKKTEKLVTFNAAYKKVRKMLEDQGIDSISFTVQYMGMIKAILVLHDHNKSNTKYLEDAELFQFPVPTIIHMLCVFLENQYRLAEIKEQAKLLKMNRLDLFSRNVANS